MKILLAVAALAGFAVCCLYAQTFGEVTGRVTDPSGAVIPGASVTLTNINTNAVRNVVTTEAGAYTFPSIPPGIYRLRTELPGFKAAASEPFEVQVQQVVRLDITLELGQISDTVEVAATADLLQAETATVGAVVENKIITELPLNGRQYLGLVALAPNTNTLSPFAGQANSRQGGDRAAQAISTGGQRIMFNYYTLDGVNNTDPNFNTYIVLPSIDAIQEFKVQLGVYPAEFGHQSTQINVLTKSGGNAYHGSLFEFLRQRCPGRSAVRIHQRPSREVTLQVERLRLRAGRAGARTQALQRAGQVVLHGQLRGTPPPAELLDHLLRADSGHVHRRLQRTVRWTVSMLT